MDVGIRELRDGLSRYLGDVRSGHVVTVTDHGRPIARIVPIEAPTALQRLIAEGRVAPARRAKDKAPKPLTTAGTVSDLIEDQRR